MASNLWSSNRINLYGGGLIMRRAFGDDDPYDRPEYLDDDMRYQQEYGEENLRQADEKANEKHDLSDLF